MASLRPTWVASIARRALRHHPTVLICSRTFATKNGTTTSKLLAQGLDRAQGKDGHFGGPGSVGPFALGVSPLGGSSSKQAPVKPWKELTTSGKVLRTTARASNLTVILIGATLSVVLTYALATELFAKNSPTVLYSDACDRIKASDELKQYLPGKLSFHTTPPMAVPTRHRNRHPISHSALEPNGTEHLLLHFWITSSHLSDAKKSEQTWTEWFTDEWDTDWDWERVATTGNYWKGKAKETWESAKQTVAFVSGISVATPQAPPLPTATTPPVEHRPTETGSGNFLGGLFRNLKGGSSRSGPSGSAALMTQWDSAEVHVDMVKDAVGNFRYRYLLVDLPNSRVSRPVRIIVEKGAGFTERDGIFMWQ
ncbi:hypothetical protein DL93DRAFT_1702843 [Clavulina sp. PMI_390]|nr:hypothetical protein DL93DRAFT_1702843 [Clavulina sp. PMI_390]